MKSVYFKRDFSSPIRMLMSAAKNVRAGDRWFLVETLARTSGLLTFGNSACNSCNYKTLVQSTGDLNEMMVESQCKRMSMGMIRRDSTGPHT